MRNAAQNKAPPRRLPLKRSLSLSLSAFGIWDGCVVGRVVRLCSARTITVKITVNSGHKAKEEITHTIQAHVKTSLA